MAPQNYIFFIFSVGKQKKVAAASTVCQKLLEFTASHDAVFNCIYLQLVLIKPRPLCVDTLAVNVTGMAGLNKALGGWGVGRSHRELWHWSQEDTMWLGVKYDIGNTERDGGREEESTAASKRAMHKWLVMAPQDMSHTSVCLSAERIYPADLKLTFTAGVTSLSVTHKQTHTL